MACNSPRCLQALPEKASISSTEGERAIEAKIIANLLTLVSATGRSKKVLKGAFLHRSARIRLYKTGGFAVSGKTLLSCVTDRLHVPTLLADSARHKLPICKIIKEETPRSKPQAKARVELKFNAATNARLYNIRQHIKAGRYFEILGRTLAIAQRGMETPTRWRRAGKLLVRLRDDASFLQEHYSVARRRHPRQ